MKILYKAIIAITSITALIALTIAKEEYELDKEAIKGLADSITGQNNTYLIATDLMNYVYYNESGACNQKSFLFERLAESKGIRTRHIVLRNVDGYTSHAISQAFVNDSWVFFDSYWGKVETQQDYINLGYSSGYIHFDCLDGNCTNISLLTKIYYYFFKVKPLWSGVIQ